MTAEHTPAAAGAMAGLPASGDRRRHPRCPVKGRAVAFYGGCTCAVHDVSVAGLALNCMVLDPEQRVAAVIDLFLPTAPSTCRACPSALSPRPASLRFACSAACASGGWDCSSAPLAVEQRHGLDRFIALPAAPPAPDRLPGQEVSPRSAASGAQPRRPPCARPLPSFSSLTVTGPAWPTGERTVPASDRTAIGVTYLQPRSGPDQGPPGFELDCGTHTLAFREVSAASVRKPCGSGRWSAGP